MSSKEAAVQKLIAAGYNAQIERGVVMIYYKNKEEYEAIKDAVRDFLRNEIDYQESFGIKAMERPQKASDEEIM